MSKLTLLLVLVLEPMMATSFSPLPLQEAAYHSANSLADLTGCNEMHVPPASLTSFIAQARIPGVLEQRLNLENFHDIALPYGDNIYNTASTMLACLSPHEQSNATCPFDPNVMYMIPPHVVIETRTELKRIQQVSTMVYQYAFEMNKMLHQHEWSDLLPTLFQASVMYKWISLLDHHSLPTLESVWNSVCDASLELPSTIIEVLPPGLNDGAVIKVSNGVLLDAFFESIFGGPLVIAIILITIFFSIELVLDPFKCRSVAKRLASCKHNDVMRRLRSC